MDAAVGRQILMAYHCSDILENASKNDGALPQSGISHNATLSSAIGHLAQYLLTRLGRPDKFSLPETVSADDAVRPR